MHSVSSHRSQEMDELTLEGFHRRRSASDHATHCSRWQPRRMACAFGTAAKGPADEEIARRQGPALEGPLSVRTELGSSDRGDGRHGIDAPEFSQGRMRSGLRHGADGEAVGTTRCDSSAGAGRRLPERHDASGRGRPHWPRRLKQARPVDATSKRTASRPFDRTQHVGA